MCDEAFKTGHLELVTIISQSLAVDSAIFKYLNFAHLYGYK